MLRTRQLGVANDIKEIGHRKRCQERASRAMTIGTTMCMCVCFNAQLRLTPVCSIEVICVLTSCSTPASAPAVANSCPSACAATYTQDERDAIS